MESGIDVFNILEIRNLTAAYDEMEVLKEINLEIKKGEVLCIVGESGSGKSTLIKAICKDPEITIKDGEIFFKDKHLIMAKKSEMRRMLGTKIGLIQQNPWGAFNPIRRIDRQFKETFKSHGKKFDEERLREIFEVLGLKNTGRILRMCPYELSGGMSQRIAIAASFALEPEILLCDEITSALDVTTAVAVTDQLLELKKTLGATIVLVTHNLGMARCIADRIAIMYQGRIVECGMTVEILSAPENDYTKRLIKDVPRLKVI